MQNIDYLRFSYLRSFPSSSKQKRFQSAAVNVTASKARSYFTPTIPISKEALEVSD